MKLELKKFDITSITDDKVVVMIGKRNTGKSFLIKDLLYYNNSFQVTRSNIWYRVGKQFLR